MGRPTAHYTTVLSLTCIQECIWDDLLLDPELGIVKGRDPVGITGIGITGDLPVLTAEEGISINRFKISIV